MTNQPGVMPARVALSAPGIRPLLISSFVLTTGVMLQAAALGKHIFDITDSELDIGWLGLAEFMPAVLLVLVTGTVADRLNRKKVSLLAQFGEFISSILLMMYALTDPTSAGPILQLQFCLVPRVPFCRLHCDRLQP